MPRVFPKVLDVNETKWNLRIRVELGQFPNDGDRYILKMMAD